MFFLNAERRKGLFRCKRAKYIILLISDAIIADFMPGSAKNGDVMSDPFSGSRAPAPSRSSDSTTVLSKRPTASSGQRIEPMSSNDPSSSQSQPFNAQSSLLAAAVRSRGADAIKPFEDELVRTLQRETRAIGDQLAQAAEQFRQMQETQETDDLRMDSGTICALKMSASTARHNKRVLLAYAMQRRNAILDAYWASSASVANTLAASSSNVSAGNSTASTGRVAEPIGKVLTPTEIDYLRAYSNLVHDLARPYQAYTVNLLGNLSSGPPRGLFTQVECVRELGEVAVGDGGGMIQFEVGSRYYVKRGEVERLIEGEFHDLKDFNVSPCTYIFISLEYLRSRQTILVEVLTETDWLLPFQALKCTWTAFIGLYVGKNACAPETSTLTG
ncbi:hypothetical protein O181_089362 [Austropuccinia psidii MF-1]|uniref:DNA replication complex GINS protein PSF1 n=1 Tax=Austropuccinia psidii MF-1 TaxID=1389203 RepID=A0A9Q3ITF7_9BASI|nr:hypothetical protein [Austropuccinia psidii MF-1]